MKNKVQGPAPSVKSHRRRYIGEAFMTVRKLEKADWHPFFDQLSKLLTGRRAEIEVASLRLGNQVEAEWLPLLGLVYDQKEDVVEVALEGLDHLIRKPREIYIEEGEGLVSSVAAVDADGIHQIIRLKEPLMLPPPQR
jgi:Family of unknown function (DUF5335)